MHGGGERNAPATVGGKSRPRKGPWRRNHRGHWSISRPLSTGPGRCRHQCHCRENRRRDPGMGRRRKIEADQNARALRQGLQPADDSHAGPGFSPGRRHQFRCAIAGRAVRDTQAAQRRLLCARPVDSHIMVECTRKFRHRQFAHRGSVIGNNPPRFCHRQ